VAKFEDLVETLRKAALILQEADAPFVLGGGSPVGREAGRRPSTIST
jgi:hypothetical protein